MTFRPTVVPDPSKNVLDTFMRSFERARAARLQDEAAARAQEAHEALMEQREFDMGMRRAEWAEERSRLGLGEVSPGQEEIARAFPGGDLPSIPTPELPAPEPQPIGEATNITIGDRTFSVDPPVATTGFSAGVGFPGGELETPQITREGAPVRPIPAGSPMREEDVQFFTGPGDRRYAVSQRIADELAMDRAERLALSEAQAARRIDEQVGPGPEIAAAADAVRARWRDSVPESIRSDDRAVVQWGAQQSETERYERMYGRRTGTLPTGETVSQYNARVGRFEDDMRTEIDRLEREWEETDLAAWEARVDAGEIFADEVPAPTRPSRAELRQRVLGEFSQRGRDLDLVELATEGQLATGDADEDEPWQVQWARETLNIPREQLEAYLATYGGQIDPATGQPRLTPTQIQQILDARDELDAR